MPRFQYNWRVEDVLQEVLRAERVIPTGICQDDEKLLLNSLVYEVEFPDGYVKEYSANIIAENMLTQVDYEVYYLTMINAIIDYDRDDSVTVPKLDGYVVTKRIQCCPRKSTQGWKILVQFSDESETWIPLKDMKESHPVETAEFDKARNIDDGAAFSLWVPYTLRKIYVIISTIKSCIWKTKSKVRCWNTVKYQTR